MDSFSKQSLDAHNKYRLRHHAPPLTWSDSMAKEAQAWANKIAKSGKLQHAAREDRKNDGENVFMMMGKPELTGDDVVDSWYSEVKKYDFRRGGFQGGTGHFTQVVWKGSKELGMGKAKTSDGKIFVVGRYRPAGNNISQVNDNVSAE